MPIPLYRLQSDTADSKAYLIQNKPLDLGLMKLQTGTNVMTNTGKVNSSSGTLRISQHRVPFSVALSRPCSCLLNLPMSLHSL